MFHSQMPKNNENANKVKYISLVRTPNRAKSVQTTNYAQERKARQRAYAFIICQGLGDIFATWNRCLPNLDPDTESVAQLEEELRRPLSDFVSFCRK